MINGELIVDNFAGGGGNAVCPPIPAALVRANLPEMCVAERTPNLRVTQEKTGQLKFA